MARIQVAAMAMPGSRTADLQPVLIDRSGTGVDHLVMSIVETTDTPTVLPQTPSLALAQISSDYADACRSVLQFLQQRYGMALWMVTRTVGNDWVVLSAADNGYGVAAGDVFRWSDSYCSKMVLGLGPRVAPDARSVEIYRNQPISEQVEIGAYVGVPLMGANGDLFGTLCAIDPQAREESLVECQPIVELVAELLSTLHASERRAERAARLAERAEHEARTDALTGVLNRRGWEGLLDLEEARCRRFGDAATVVSVDLDDLKRVNDAVGHDSGDALLQRTAWLLRSALRDDDVVARVGGDEFTVLALRADAAAARQLVDRLRQRFQRSGIAASIGAATRDPRAGLRAAADVADKAMLDDKRARKGGFGR